MERSCDFCWMANLKLFAETKGRPLGIHFDKKENLIVCDSYKGLLSINPQGKVKVLATSADEVPFKYTDALDISSDGTIYFTDASSRYGQTEYLYDLLESNPHGRFLSYDPATGKILVLKAFGIPAAANVCQTDHSVSIEGETQCSSCGLLRKSVTAFAASLKFLMAAPLS